MTSAALQHLLGRQPVGVKHPRPAWSERKIPA